MPNKTISLPSDVIPIVERLGVPFSQWVADQLRRHASTENTLTFEQQLAADAELAEGAPPSREDSRATVARMDRTAPW